VLLLIIEQFQSRDAADDSWVYRRVERLALIDDSSLRRRISIDFMLPPMIRGVPTSNLRYVPLTWLPPSLSVLVSARGIERATAAEMGREAAEAELLGRRYATFAAARGRPSRLP
jgi:hypothetical protein